MSATHPDASVAPSGHASFAADHPQLTPFLVALAIFAVSGLVALMFTGLPG